MNKKDIKYLLNRYINQEATTDECEHLFVTLGKKEDAAAWEQAIRELIEQQTADTEYTPDHWESIIQNILSQDQAPLSAPDSPITIKPEKRIKSKYWLTRSHTAVAAVIIILLGLCTWFNLEHTSFRQKAPVSTTTTLKNDIPPGRNKAVLTLANGQKVILDSMHSGLLSTQGGTKIIKVSNGTLKYSNQVVADAKQSVTNYNTITTPAGGKYKVILPDGSKVWLNAVSSIRFPTVFTGKERRVKMTGEAYFEIKQKASMPFVVELPAIRYGKQGGELKVLGTNFNVMAYKDESAINTTLLEGKIKVTVDNRQPRILKPGQRASIISGTDNITITKGDIEEIVAWKNGLFQFSDADIATIMRQIARWYDVEVIYQKGVPPGRITGKIPRNTNLSNVLKIMQLSGVHFKIAGRKLIVLNS